MQSGRMRPMSLRRGSGLLIVVCALLPISLVSAAEEGCTGCGESAFPEAAAFIAGKGFPSDAYTVLLSWQEAARTDVKTLVTGYHVLPVAGGEPFDLYSARDGNLLNAADLAALGIPAKHWQLPPVEQLSEIPAAVAKQLPARPEPFGAPAKASAATVELLPLDVQSLIDEDRAGDAAKRKGPSRMGVVRTLAQPVVLKDSTAPSAGSWETLADGARLWTATLHSPDARALRVHFAALAVPSGGRLIIYNARLPKEAYGPYLRPEANDTDLWSASCFSDTVAVECYLPPKTDAVVLNVVIDAIAHTYADFGLMEWSKVAAGPCHNDVTCYSEWAAVARGVAGFTFVSRQDQVYCTGTLIADSDPNTQIPYFLTANHCVSIQDGSLGASSMEFFWFYQTPSCNGTPPALADVSRTTGGADFLAGGTVNTSSDFALVRLRKAPPANATFVGWTTDVPTIGTLVAAIHHPEGEYKRISFGTLTNTGSPTNNFQPLWPYDLFHEVRWDDGSTERASSGSPLLLLDRKLIIGQLWGGYAACDFTEEPDYFGRFDKSYAVLEAWLAPNGSPYDIDGSGSVNSADVQLVVNAALGMPGRYNADVDRSGTVDAVDVQLVILAVLGIPAR